MSLADPRWETATNHNSSPVERDRDRQIERAIEADGRPLSILGVIAEQTGTRWKVEVLGRDLLLERLDARGRHWSTNPEAAQFVKGLAAWIRSLPPSTCPQLFRWDRGDGQYDYQRGTIARAAAERPVDRLGARRGRRQS